MDPTPTSCPRCGALLQDSARFCMHCGLQTSAAEAAAPSAPDPVREQLAAATAGEYAILSELGRGGMAAVYLAEDLSLGRRVAVKVMIPGLAATAGMADRFLLEARTAAQLSHPGIIPIYAVRTTGELRYFVMKYVAGRSLDQVLAATGPLPPALVGAILAQVGPALEHAHERGVIHRDIKPANIMLDEDGSAIVADFGIAKVGQGTSLTRTGSTVGTPSYMSPEQCTGKTVTGASDQYALGCVAFELLTGRPPFVHEEVIPVLLAHVSEAPPPLLPLRHDCPLSLAAAVERMLAKSPEDRWPSLTAAVLAGEVASVLNDPVVRARLRDLARRPGGPAAPVRATTPRSPVPVPGRGASPAHPHTPSGIQLQVEPAEALLHAGTVLPLRATVLDAAGHALSGAAPVWRSQAPEVVTVSPSGVVTALSEGEALVTVTCQDAATAVRLKVARVPVARIVLSPAPTAWPPGERRVLQAVVLDAAGAVLPGRAIHWLSLDPGVATVDRLGVVLGVGEGRARIQAESEGQLESLEVEIRRAQGKLAILPGAGALAAGQVVPLAAVWQGGPGPARPAAGAEWMSTDPGILRISADGELTALRPGSAGIRARLGDQVAEVAFQVTRVDVAQVRILPRLAALGVGEEARLSAEASDRLGATLTGRVVTWHSTNAQVAVVSADGVVRGVAPGAARIGATIGAGLAWLDIRVTPAAVGGIRIEPPTVSLRLGEMALLRASVVTVKGGTLAGIPIEWQSSDAGVASVTPEGVVRGLRFGSARIAATAGGRRATVAVEVRAPNSTTISAPKLRASG